MLATVYNCSTVAQIRSAMASASAGDEIVIAAGTYTATNVATSGSSAYYYGAANGTAANPITIRSASSSNPATLSGDDNSSLTVLRIEGNYWIVRDLKMTKGQKGLVFDNANHCQAIDCEMYGTGNEALHVRDGSDYTLIDGCYIHDAGEVNAGFGEGIYIGTDKGSWSSYDPYVSYTTVKNCTIGPNVRAEAFDIKEGTDETVVENCTVDATGISGSNFADSFIDLKGTRTYVRCNTFNRNGASNLTKGIAVIDRGVSLSSYEHAVHGNTFNMDNSSGNMLEAYSGTADVYGWNNTRNPSGDNYNSRVTTSCCPSWYSSPPSCGGGGGGTCNAPNGLSTSGITSSEATLNWNSVSGASSYDLRYRESSTSTWTTVSSLSGTSRTQTGLSASTTYNWQVRTDCGGSNSTWNAGSNFTTSASGGGGSGGGSGTGLTLYDDVLASGWNEYSYNGSYDLSHSINVQVGSDAIEAAYTGWGGVLLKTNTAESLSGYDQLQFWVKSDGSHKMRVKMSTNLGTKTREFYTSGSWQQITMSLSLFGSPSSLTEFRLENRSSSSFTTYYDQIEFVSTSTSRLGKGPAGVAVRLFPNPAQRSLLVSLPEAEHLVVEVFDLRGQMVLSQRGLGESLKLDLAALPAGMYLARVNGQAVSFIKQAE